MGFRDWGVESVEGSEYLVILFLLASVIALSYTTKPCLK